MLTKDDYAKAFHEIKNSITIIRSSLQLLEKQHPEIAEFEYWQDSQESLGYLSKMVLELSQARLASDFTMKPVDLNSLLDHVLFSIRGVCANKDFHCECQINPALPAILADSFRLTQAIINLMKNSYEAMNESGNIILKAYPIDQFVRIEIIDFGGGIQPEYQQKLFTPFCTSKQNGTGLGLSITRQIVESHNGTLEYESRTDDGCTFTIQLPALESSIQK